MGSAFHQLCPRLSGTLTPTVPTAIRLWETFTFTKINLDLQNNNLNNFFMGTCNNDFTCVLKLSNMEETVEGQNQRRKCSFWADIQ